MRRIPLADQMPYRFYPPRHSRVCHGFGRHYIGHLLRGPNRVARVEIEGLEHLAGVLGRGDGVMLTPNHPDHADCYALYRLGMEVGRRFYYMAAYQIFRGINGWVLPRIGVFPVDREGADLTAFKTGVDLLARGEQPLVIFPEGEIYYLSGRLTPIREGAAMVATTAARKLPEGRTIWVVPMAIQYRFLDGVDPLPSLHRLMDQLETTLTWRPRRDRGLFERIYGLAEGVLGLKEYEYLGAYQSGPLPARIAALRDHILASVERRRLGRTIDDTPPVRVKELRRACLEALADPATTPEQAEDLRHDLADLFLAVQCFSYPGDYLRECPTLERAAETLMKLEEDLLGAAESPPRAPRRAILKLGEPIDVRARLAAAPKPRLAATALTAELESRIQSLIDAIPPGRPIPGAGLARPAPLAEPGAVAENQGLEPVLPDAAQA